MSLEKLVANLEFQTRATRSFFHNRYGVEDAIAPRIAIRKITEDTQINGMISEGGPAQFGSGTMEFQHAETDSSPFNELGQVIEDGEVVHDSK